MGEGDCVQELNLDKRIFWINIEVYVDHNVKNDNQAEDYEI